MKQRIGNDRQPGADPPRVMRIVIEPTTRESRASVRSEIRQRMAEDGDAFDWYAERGWWTAAVADAVRAEEPIDGATWYGFLLSARATEVQSARMTALWRERCAADRRAWCSCGRASREVLDGGGFGPTGWCGITGAPPLDPCDCGQGVGRHDRSVCHVYGLGMVRAELAVAR